MKIIPFFYAKVLDESIKERSKVATEIRSQQIIKIEASECIDMRVD